MDVALYLVLRRDRGRWRGAANSVEAVEARTVGALNAQERARLLDSRNRAGDALASLSASSQD